MEIEWMYDNPDGGTIYTDPDEYIGMSATEIEERIVASCRHSAKRNSTCYVLELDVAVQSIISALDK